MPFADELYNNGHLSNSQKTVLKDTILNAFHEAEYKKLELNSLSTINASSIREICAKLAKHMVTNNKDEELQNLLDEAKLDALPEVRFANYPNQI